MYLVYTPLEKIAINEQQSLAFDLGISALVSKDIYNFGELVIFFFLSFSVNIDFLLSCTQKYNSSLIQF